MHAKGSASVTEEFTLEDVSFWHQALARQLCRLFERLNVSMRQYGKQCHVDGTVVSRYLAGTRLPSPHFVACLLRDVEQVGGSLGFDELRRLTEVVARSRLTPADEAHYLVGELEERQLDAFRDMPEASRADMNYVATLELRRHGTLQGESFHTNADGSVTRWIVYGTRAYHCVVEGREKTWDIDIVHGHPDGGCGP